jgi:hypothetical protein
LFSVSARLRPKSDLDDDGQQRLWPPPPSRAQLSCVVAAAAPPPTHLAVGGALSASEGAPPSAGTESTASGRQPARSTGKLARRAACAARSNECACGRHQFIICASASRGRSRAWPNLGRPTTAEREGAAGAQARPRAGERDIERLAIKTNKHTDEPASQPANQLDSRNRAAVLGRRRRLSGRLARLCLCCVLLVRLIVCRCSRAAPSSGPGAVSLVGKLSRQIEFSVRWQASVTQADVLRHENEM